MASMLLAESSLLRDAKIWKKCGDSSAKRVARHDELFEPQSCTGSKGVFSSLSFWCHNIKRSKLVQSRVTCAPHFETESPTRGHGVGSKTPAPVDNGKMRNFQPAKL